MDKTRWGIISTGYIAERFVQSLAHVGNCEVAAVASRTQERAQVFADKYQLRKAYGSYEQLAQDPDIDVIYVATPNNRHMQDCMMMMDAGKNVLCEKPMAVNARQVAAMIEKAKQADVFLMEGMWTRFFPAVIKGLEWVKDGSIGEARTLFANFGIDGGDTTHWKLRREMAGGSMVDVGIYPLAMAFDAFGTDFCEVSTTAHVHNGVDYCNAVTLKYPDGKIAVLGSSLTVKMENKVVICGTKGRVKIGEGYDWWRANRAELTFSGDDPFTWSGANVVHEVPYPSVGFQFEAGAVQEYLSAGAKEAAQMPWAESLKIAQTIDKLREKWGVVYNED